MRNLEEFDDETKTEIVKLYLGSEDWSHRRLQKEILKIDAPQRGGGFVVMEILRSFGIGDDSLKGIFSKVTGLNELAEILALKQIHVRSTEIIQDLYIAYLNNGAISRRTFLLTWNPEEWIWETFEADLSQYKSEGKLTMRWGCGNRKNIAVGDRLFFIKLGKMAPRGIMASGYAVRKSYEAEHWSKESGRKGLNINIEFDVLLDYRQEEETKQMIGYDILSTDSVLKEQSWSVQASGTIIDQKVAERLEEIWKETFLSQFKQYFSKDTSLYKEGRLIHKVSKRFERNRTAREECLKVHKHSCKACGLDFEKRYGQIGKGFIHVHHVVPLSQRAGEYNPDPVKDLIPLCPNCHAMIHRLDPPYELIALKELLSKNT